MKLSEILRKYRREHDLSQREFAKRCGLSNSYISFLENECNPKTGKPMTPTIEQYKKLADAMSVSLHELIKSLDKDSSVVLTDLIESPQLFEEGVPPDPEPANDNVRLLINGANRMDPEDIEQLTDMMRVMFAKKYPHLFDEKGTEDNANT